MSSTQGFYFRCLSSVILVLTGIAACESPENDFPSGDNQSASVVSRLLAEPLWVARDAYDASHHLMVPMHAAFAGYSGTDVRRFDLFFQRFLEEGSDTFVTERLDRLHFLYWYSRYVVLGVRWRGCGPREQGHLEHLSGLWVPIVMDQAWQWDSEPFDTLFDRVEWRLSQTTVRQSYYRALIDEDMFALAIGADLKNAADNCGTPSRWQYEHSRELALQAFSQEVSTSEDGGWVFQKGVWRDHPDYQYAGNAEIKDGLEPMPVEDIATDSSHSFRLPLFLTSFAAAEAEGSYGRVYYEQLLQGLAVQITKRVLLMPDAEFPGVRMTNYMDGRNGVHRYGYASQGEGSGFGPYELSGSFSLGWWGFLGKALTEAYEAQRQSLPFRDEVVEVYTGPNTLRQRNIQFAEPGFYQQELIREVLGAAAFVSVNRPWGAQNKVATR